MKALLENRWALLTARVFLGAVFIYSGWTKIADPPGFAQMVWNYGILPGYLVNAVALTLPWAELAAGAALVAGIWQRGAALLIALMLIGFIGGIGLNLARGNPIDCGCFSTAAVAKSPEELFAAMKLDIVRDLGLLLLAGLIFRSGGRSAGLGAP